MVSNPSIRNGKAMGAKKITLFLLLLYAVAGALSCGDKKDEDNGDRERRRGFRREPPPDEGDMDPDNLEEEGEGEGDGLNGYRRSEDGGLEDEWDKSREGGFVDSILATSYYIILRENLEAIGYEIRLSGNGWKTFTRLSFPNQCLRITGNQFHQLDMRYVARGFKRIFRWSKKGCRPIPHDSAFPCGRPGNYFISKGAPRTLILEPIEGDPPILKSQTCKRL